MRNARVDTNQKEIVTKLREQGCTVLSLATIGRGAPDICVGYMGANYLFEIKSTRGKLNEKQIEWFASWRGQVHEVRTLENILKVIKCQ